MEGLKMELRSDRVLVEQVEAIDKVGDIYIPNNSKVQKNEGIVVAIGPGKNGKRVSLKVGQKVIFRQRAGVDFPFNDKVYLMMSDDDVFAII